MMLSTRVVSLLARPLARAYSAPAALPVREVMVSQSRDLARNVALEDWAVRNINLDVKNILILTNNLSLSPQKETILDVKATLLDPNVIENAAAFEDLVLSSLPPSLMLAALPEVSQQLEPLAVAHTVRLVLPAETKTKEVLGALHRIAGAFLKDQGGLQRMSLVRPDDGWFPGLEDVQRELEVVMKNSGKVLSKREAQEERKRGRMEKSRPLQNSYGQLG